MASEFDNEIDFLLRQAARSNNFAPENVAGEHLDADDLIAFAENALPQSARPNFILHLADCNSCRETLSNLVLLNEAADEEVINPVELEKPVVVTRLSWLDSFRKLFAFPTLGYATAVLAVLFVGVFAFVALRPTQNNETSQLVQTTVVPVETPAKKRSSAPAAEQKDEEVEPRPEESPAETLNSNTDIPVENTPTQSIEMAENLPPSVRITRGENSGNRNSAPPETSVARNNLASSNSAANAAVPGQNQPNTNSAGATVTRQEAPKDTTTALPAAPKRTDEAKAELLARSNADQVAETQDDKDVTDIASANERRAVAAKVSPRLAKKLSETRTVNGKSFQKLGGIWIDTDYNSQNVTNVSRGSDEYKRLDNGLRSIAERLSGEIIVVWQGKAHKIR